MKNPKLLTMTFVAGLSVMACGGVDPPASTVDALLLEPPITTIHAEDTWTVDDYRPGEYLLGTYLFGDTGHGVTIEVTNDAELETLVISDAGRWLFAQSMDRGGDIEILAGPREFNPYPAMEAEKDRAYLEACAEIEGWRCFIEQLDVLAHLGYAPTDVYPLTPLR